MSDRMSDEEFLLLEDGIEDNERPDSAATVVLQEARRSREAEERLRSEAEVVRAELRKHIIAVDDVPTVQLAEALGACLRHHQRELREAGFRHAEEIRGYQASLTAAHAERDAERARAEKAEEAMDTLRVRIASLEAERAALAARRCHAVHCSAHGLLVCTREHGHAPPCSLRRKRPEEKCPVCTGACEWDKETTG